MKVLLITSKPPYPSIDGGCFASARFIDSLLTIDCELDLFTISTPKHPFEVSAFPAGLNVSQAFVNTDVSIVGAFKSLFSKESYNVSRFDSPAAHETLKVLFKKDYTHVIFDNLFSTPYLETVRQNSNAKLYIRTHNVENSIWEQHFQHERNPFKRFLLKGFYKKLMRYELDTLNSVNGIFSISKDDTILFEKQGVRTPISHIPVGLETKDKDFTVLPNKFFHIGSMNWQPNVDAVNRLISILPEIIENNPDAKLHIAGSETDKLNTSSASISKDGFIEDVHDYAINKGVMVSPITSGSGVKIKVLEMLSYGVPVITTTKGSEGLESTSMIKIADSDEELVEAITVALKDKDGITRLGKKGREYIKSHHDIKMIGEQINKTLNEA